MFSYSYLIEILTPLRSGKIPLAEAMDRFAERYQRIIASGSGVSIPDNPMGRPRCSALEAISRSEFPVDSERVVVNLNTFHEKRDLDAFLKDASEIGIKYLLIIRGDGGPELPKLDPKAIGGSKSVATSIDLLKYINTEYPEIFVTGAAFNQYNPISFETDRMKQKCEAGAKFIITQPVLGKDPNIDLLLDFNVPVVIEAWMSTKVDLLLKSVKRQEDKRAEGYDPIENLEVLHNAYPQNCFYLSMLSFNQDWESRLPNL
jgi:5,10-methylenetetrahydrofolate reductase